MLPKDSGGIGHVRLHLLLLALRRQRQVEPYEFKGRLVYILSLSLVNATESQRKKTNQDQGGGQHIGAEHMGGSDKNSGKEGSRTMLAMISHVIAVPLDEGERCWSS